MEILCDVLLMLRCDQCGKLDLMFTEDEINTKGYASSLCLLCENCGWKQSFYTSKQQGKSFAVNRRIVYAMRTLGKGHTDVKPLLEKNIQRFPTSLRVVCHLLQKKAWPKQLKMSEIWKRQNDSAGTEPVKKCCETGISIDIGKVLDIEALSQACKQSELREHLDKNSEEYQRWRADHIACKVNFKAPPPTMEPEGVHQRFKRSVELHNLWYTKYYGDGDSKSFSKVNDV